MTEKVDVGMLNALEYRSFVGSSLKSEVKSLIGLEGIREVGLSLRDQYRLIGSEEFMKVAIDNERPDISFDVGQSQWREKIDKYESTHERGKILMMLDGMNFLESWLSVDDNNRNKKNIRHSISNFYLSCIGKYGVAHVDEFRAGFSDRMELFSQRTVNSSYAENLSVDILWKSMGPSDRMPLVYEAASVRFWAVEEVRPVYLEEAEATHEFQDISVEPIEYLTSIASEVPQMLPEVYKEFRGGGFEKGRVGIETFDRAVGWLCSNGGIVFDDNGCDPSINAYSVNALVVSCLTEMVREWHGSRGKFGEETLSRELLASIERWSLNYEMSKLIDKTVDIRRYFKSFDDYEKNIGVRGGVGLILTEKTRVSKKLEIQKKYHSKVRKLHPDLNADTVENSEKLIQANKINSILTDAEKFGKLSGGR